GIGAGAHGKLSFPHRIVRQVRHRQPELYMDKALAGDAVAQAHEVARAELPLEFMLNALRLKDGFSLTDYTERTGMPPSSIATALAQAEQSGWLRREGAWIQPTARGFDFLSDLQQLFLPAA
ncbi:MAG TPA: oxygen-independent coproporphyrinogen III oxidase-like protein, partial [Ottowia sp.]|nr:oxygen-independent coproporphyrinogen III oxidase-like protein [Ottowia sp.]